MSFLQGLFSKTWKVFREQIPSLSARPGIKGTGGGCTVTNQTSAGFTIINKGDEAGWHYTEGTPSRKFGSWSQATPALWNKNTNKINVILNKAQLVDPSYLQKNAVTQAGDSAENVRVATIEEDGAIVPGIIVTCLNHSAQEQIFFPIGGTTESGG